MGIASITKWEDSNKSDAHSTKCKSDSQKEDCPLWPVLKGSLSLLTTTLCKGIWKMISKTSILSPFCYPEMSTKEAIKSGRIKRGQFVRLKHPTRPPRSQKTRWNSIWKVLSQISKWIGRSIDSFLCESKENRIMSQTLRYILQKMGKLG